jgi:hypothetical protein
MLHITVLHLLGWHAMYHLSQMAAAVGQQPLGSSPAAGRAAHLVAEQGPELIQVDDGLEVLVLPDVEVPHADLPRAAGKVL